MDTEDRLRAVDGNQPNEPIAILGMGCRFPGGVSSPEDLWQLVVRGTRRHLRVPRRPRLGPRALYDPDPDAPGATYVPRRRVPATTPADFDAGVLRDLPA